MSLSNRDLSRLGISALSPGLWRVAMPFPSPMSYSFSYLLRFADGYVAVDLGWDDDQGWDLFQQGLTRAGGSLDDLRGVVISHAHPDHYGLAARVRNETPAWIALHPAELPQVAGSEHARRHRVAEIEAWLRVTGAPAEAVPELLSDRDQLMRDLSSEQPDVELKDAAAVPGTAGQLMALHTPGHTPGHMVFYDRERNILFTGDHLLPRVSVNVSARPTSAPDPLGDYLASLEVLAPYGSALAAPGHEWAFDRLDERRQWAARHHRARLEEIEAAVRDGAHTAWEVAATVTWSRSFQSLNPRGKRSALGETMAHLVRLRAQGRIASQGEAAAATVWSIG